MRFKVGDKVRVNSSSLPLALVVDVIFDLTESYYRIQFEGRTRASRHRWYDNELVEITPLELALL